MFDEEDKNTSVVDPDPKYVGSVRTDKDVSKHIASGRKPTPSYSILETSRTGQHTDGALSHKEGRNSVPESLRPQISSLTCTRGLDAFWNEINGMDDVFGEHEERSAWRGSSSLSRAKSGLAISDTFTKLERMKTSVTANAKSERDLDERFLKPQTKRTKRRRKSAPESQSPRLPSLPLARERSVH